MPDQHDAVLVDQARIHRMRLGAALLYGRIDERRTVNDHLRRLMGSLIITAVACAACVAVSFVVQLLADQEEAAQDATPAPVSTVYGGAR